MSLKVYFRFSCLSHGFIQYLAIVIILIKIRLWYQKESKSKVI